MKFVYVYRYWIYSVNNWGIFMSWRVFVRPSHAGFRNMFMTLGGTEMCIFKNSRLYWIYWIYTTNNWGIYAS